MKNRILNIIDEISQSNKMNNNKNLFFQLWNFLKARKAWWLSPLIIMIVLVGLLVIFAQSSAISPFIYTLF